MLIVVAQTEQNWFL